MQEITQLLGDITCGREGGPISGETVQQSCAVLISQALAQNPES